VFESLKCSAAIAIGKSLACTKPSENNRFNHRQNLPANTATSATLRRNKHPNVEFPIEAFSTLPQCSAKAKYHDQQRYPVDTRTLCVNLHESWSRKFSTGNAHPCSSMTLSCTNGNLLGFQSCHHDNPIIIKSALLAVCAQQLLSRVADKLDRGFLDE
jgi:hypothetical protein